MMIAVNIIIALLLGLIILGLYFFNSSLVDKVSDITERLNESNQLYKNQCKVSDRYSRRLKNYYDMNISVLYPDSGYKIADLEPIDEDDEIVQYISNYDLMLKLSELNDDNKCHREIIVKEIMNVPKSFIVANHYNIIKINDTLYYKSEEKMWKNLKGLD